MISEQYIMKLVRDYAKSPEGKKAIKETYGVDYDEKKDSYRMQKYVDDMKKILYKHILSIPSRRGDSAALSSISIDDINVDIKVSKKGVITASISINEQALHRASLDPVRFPEGIQNILLLFTKGFNTSGTVRGNWQFNGRMVAENIEGVRHRSPSTFLADAVSEFNNKYKGVAVAKLSGKYANAINEMGGENGEQE